jgi:outer membrane protein
MNINKLKTSLIALALILGTLGLNAQNARIGHMDYQAIILDMPQFKVYIDSLKAYSESLEKNLVQIQDEYEVQFRKVKKLEENPTGNRELLELARETLRSTEILFQQEMQRNQERMQIKREKLLEPLKKIVDDAVESIAKEKGFTAVMDVNSLIYKRDTDDIEELVRTKLKLINKAESKQKRDSGMMDGMQGLFND